MERGKSGRADGLERFDLIKRPHLINPRSWRLPLVIRSPLVTGARFIHISYGILIRKNKDRLRTLNPPKYLLCRRCSKLIPRSLITRDDVFSHTRTIDFQRFLEELAAFLLSISSFSLYTKQAVPFLHPFSKSSLASFERPNFRGESIRDSLLFIANYFFNFEISKIEFNFVPSKNSYYFLAP